MNQSSYSGQVLWWIFGAIVVVLSGVGAYIYSSKGATSVAPVATTTSTSSNSTGSNKATTAAITATELDSSASAISTGLSALDSNLSDLDNVPTVEETPSL